MKNISFTFICVCLLLLAAGCKKDEEETGRKLTGDEIKELVQISVSGYTAATPFDNLPENYNVGHVNTNASIVIGFGVAKATDGKVIHVNDFQIRSNFITEEVEQVKVNGIDVYQAFDQNHWRAVIFYAQYTFTFVANGQTAQTGSVEVNKFVQVLTSKLSTF